MSEAAQPVLELAGLTVASVGEGESELRAVDFRVLPGEVALLSWLGDALATALYDAAEGLREPDEGAVLFMGRDWRKMGAFDEGRARGRIGRVFENEREGWVSNLTVYENVVLSQLHHTRRTEAEIRAEAERLARGLGLAAVPGVRPDYANRHELRRAEWVRAFMGQPALILLERPEIGAPGEAVKRLIEMARSACAVGSAVVWSTSDAQVFRHSGFEGARRYVVRERGIVPAEESP